MKMLAIFLILYFIGGKYFETDEPVELDRNGVLVFSATKKPVPEKSKEAPAKECRT